MGKRVRTYHLWCDASCQNDDVAKASGLGVVLVHPSGKVTARGIPLTGESNSNQDEIRAILAGLKAIRRGARVVVHTDSQAAIQHLTGQTSGPTFLRLRREVAAVSEKFVAVSYEKVRAHAMIPLNTIADRLARKARTLGRKLNYRDHINNPKLDLIACGLK